MATSVSIFGGTIVGDDYTIDCLANGHLKCDECNTYWCLHIQGAITNRLDAEHIFYKEENAELPSRHIEVPMVPSSNQWAAVTLEPSTLPSMLAYEVVLAEKQGSEEELHFLGYLHPGEGRMVLRSMVYDWFVGHVNTDGVKCQSRGHKMKQELKWQEDMSSSGNRAVAQLWSVWNTGSCLGCGFTLDGIDDLIPDDDRKMPGTR